MKVLLTTCKLPIGNGWDKTIKKLMEEYEKNTESIDNFSELNEFYYNHLFIGEKAVKIFRSERERIDELIALFQSYTQEIEETSFHECYPFILPEERLEKVNLLPIVVEIQDTHEKLCVVFCSVRSFTERTEIDISTLEAESQNKLSYYDNIFGTKKIIKQFFDIVVIWKTKNFIEVRIDIVNNLLPQERNRAFEQVIEQFLKLVQQKLNVEIMLGNYINFFPIINNLYKSDEGKVIELSFITDGGSTKSEKMRKDAVDLRNEPYHKAGIKAVHHITPYHLTILWNFETSEKIKNEIELTLPAKSYDLNSSTPSLQEVLITKCNFQEEYNFILSKINTYLNYVR